MNNIESKTNGKEFKVFLPPDMFSGLIDIYETTANIDFRNVQNNYMNFFSELNSFIQNLVNLVDQGHELGQLEQLIERIISNPELDPKFQRFKTRYAEEGAGLEVSLEENDFVNTIVFIRQE